MMSCAFHSDQTLTTDAVAEVMTAVNDLKSLTYYSYVAGDRIISQSLLEAIQRKCSTKREVATECAYYFTHCRPQPSWTLLATRLCEQAELTAVEKVKPFLPLRGENQVIR